MTLPIKPPFPPMEARLVAEAPEGKQWQYEPKWDGFRCLAFKDGEKIFLQSKSGQPLARYFPDVVALLNKLKAKQFVLDGEIVIPLQGRSSFDQLLQRIHPAASRVKMLAEKFPAIIIAFDLLVNEKGKSIVEQPLTKRRIALERFAKIFLARSKCVRLSPMTSKLSSALHWFHASDSGLDGIVAKQIDLPYRSGNRDGMLKIKHSQTAACVVGGFRYGEGTRTLGSLLLGLYDEKGLLNHVGFTSSFSAAQRKTILTKLRQLMGGTGFTGKAPGGPSRWSTKRSSEWHPLKPKLVVEVQYDSFTGERFRHGTNLLRFRTDKKPKDCNFEQLTTAGVTLKLLEV